MSGKTVHDQFIGVADETTYAVGVAPSFFLEPTTGGDSVTGTYERIESEAIRGPLLRADRFATNPKGAAGQWTFEVLDKGFGFWLKHMLGAVDTTTPGTFIATPGVLAGKSFSGQAARYASGSDSLVPFGYHGGKVTEWELSCAVDQVVKLALTCDFAKEVINGSGVDALATPTYTAATQLLTFVGADVLVGGTELVVSSVTLTGNNGLKVDRYGLRGASGTTKREPKSEDAKTLAFELNAEFEDTTQVNRVANALASGALASLSLTFNSPAGGTLTVSCPAGRFDEGPVQIDRKVTALDLKGMVLAPADGTAPITVTYVEAA